MIIIQKPDSFCFENNLPDIIIERTGVETSIIFKLYHGATQIIEEKYVFDSNLLIFIRDLSRLVSFYFDNTVIQQADYTVTNGLIKTFTFTIDDSNTQTFTVIKSAAVISGISATNFIRSSFLTRTPRQKNTTINSNEFLSFVMLANDDPFNIKFRLYYKSSIGQVVEQNGVLLQVNHNQAAHGVITFNASLKKVLEAANINPDQVLEYRIWAECSPLEIVFNQYSFFPDYSLYGHRNFFLFENCFGVPETFMATGVTVISKNLDASFAMSGKRMKKVTQEFEMLYESNSGFKSAIEMDWLDDFITSYNVSISRKGILQEVVITQSDKSDSDNNSLKSFAFKYRNTGNVHLHFSVSGIFDNTFDQTFE